MARLKDYYVDTVAPALMKKFNYKSVMEIPKLDKVIVNVGAGEAISNSKVIDAIVNDITQITGQKPVICRAKKSVEVTPHPNGAGRSGAEAKGISGGAGRPA